MHHGKIEEGSFFISKVALNEFIISYNFHELSWSMQFTRSNSIDTATTTD